MMRTTKAGRWGGRALILATLLTVCAALIPSQASAAPLTKKASFGNSAAVGSCSFTVENVDLTAGTVRFKVTANARAVGFQGLTNKQTTVACAIYDGNVQLVAYQAFVGGNTVNQTKRFTIATTPVPFFLCGQIQVEKRNGTFVYSDPGCA
jgi:hypothetical protein